VIAEDWRKAGLTGREEQFCIYAEKLSQAPGAVNEKDIAALRANGISDEEILHLVEITSYFNFVNRLADGLHVELEGNSV